MKDKLKALRVPVKEKTLEQRLKDSIHNCQATKKYRKAGETDKEESICYCTLHFPETLNDPAICPYRGNIIEVRKYWDEVVFSKIRYYQCKR